MGSGLSKPFPLRIVLSFGTSNMLINIKSDAMGKTMAMVVLQYSYLSIQGYDQSSIAVRGRVYSTERLRFECDSRPRLNARSLSTQQRMGTWL